jgi:hypothetical protein
MSLALKYYAGQCSQRPEEHGKIPPQPLASLQGGDDEAEIPTDAMTVSVEKGTPTSATRSNSQQNACDGAR